MFFMVSNSIYIIGQHSDVMKFNQISFLAECQLSQSMRTTIIHHPMKAVSPNRFI